MPVDDEKQVQLYLVDTYLTEVASTVLRTGETDDGNWVVLRDNIFHPQGGGQPADRGWVGAVEVRPMRLPEDTSLIAVAGTGGPALTAEVGDEVAARVDAGTRLRHAALHTAGHLVDAATRRRGFTHIVSNHFPDQARIEFEAAGPVDGEELVKQIQAEVDAVIADALAVTSETTRDGRRVVRIGDFSVDECGGTHVRTLAELGGVTVRSVKVKKGRLKVGYDAGHLESGRG